MFKRLISLILAFALSVAIIPSFAAAETTDEKSLIASDEKINLVLQLGLFEKDGEGKYNFDSPVTRGEFAILLYKILSYKENGHEISETAFADVKPWDSAAVAIQYLHNQGLVLGYGDGNYNPDEPITAEHAYRVLLCAANYGMVINTGSQAAIMNTARNAELSEGVTAAADSTVTVGELVRIIYNFLDSIVVDYTLSGTGISKVENGATVSEEFMDLIKITGIAYSDSHFSIVNEALGDETINIGGKILRTGSKDYCDYVGYLVTAYYTSDDVSNESVAAIVKSTKKNSTLVIESEDIYKFENSRYYYTDSNGTRKSIAVKGSTSVLYNYEILTDAEQYVPDNGSITLISNDGDTTYDVLLIEDYADYCIKSIDTTNNRLVVEAVDDASRVVLSMTDEKIRLFDSEGNKGMLADLVADNIISIPKNYEDKQFPAKYIYSAKTVSGKLTGSSDEGSYYAVNIGGAEYRGKECGDTYAKYNNSEITARFNFRGMIVFIDNAGGTLSGDFRYGYVIRARQIETEDGIDAYQLKMLDQDGSIYLLECDEKTRLDGDITNFETLASVFYDSDKNMTKRQPVRYKTTGNGTIRYIDLPGNNSIGTTNNCLLKRVDGLYLYKGTTRIFKRLMSGSEGEAILDDNAVILRVPPRESPRDYDDEEFEVVGAHQVPRDDYCTIQAYNTDTDALSMSMCVVYMNGGTSFSTSDQSMMIQKVKEIYDEDVGATYEITTLHNNTQSTYVMSEPSVLTDEKGSRLNIGDIIRVLTNKDGYVTTVELLYSKASGAGIVNGSNEIYGGGINADFRMSYGNPYKVQNGNIQLTYNVAETGDEYFRAGGAPVYVYDSSLSSGKVYQGSIGDIWETRYGYNNKVLIQQFQTGVSQIYVIK